MIDNPIAAILHNVKTGRYHPILYREAPLPGNPENLIRHKSSSHHTEGFDTRDKAIHYIAETLAKYPHCAGLRFCDEDYPWDPDAETIPASVAYFVESEGKLTRTL